MCLLIIVGVSAIDAYLNMKYTIISYHEENPLAEMILKHSGEDVPLLIALKLFGTSIAAAFLTAAFHHQRRTVALVIAAIVAAFQLMILAYMHH